MDALKVLWNYRTQLGDVEPALTYLGSAGGFSGAQFWRVGVPSGEFCLRQWPAGKSISRLEWIQRVLDHVWADTRLPLARPLRTDDARRLVECFGGLWQLEPWMPGRADFWECPDPERLSAALAALARFHQSAVRFVTQRNRCSPSILHRLGVLRQLRDGRWDAITCAIDPRQGSALEVLCRDICRCAQPLIAPVCRRLELVAGLRFDLMPCIRDIWHDHIFFVQRRVSAMIDFESLRMDWPAIDVARLTGSMVGDNAAMWQVAVEAYQSVSPIPSGSPEVLTALDSSTTLISATNWLDWMYLGGRDFEDWERVAARLRRILERLERLAAGKPGIS